MLHTLKSIQARYPHLPLSDVEALHERYSTLRAERTFTCKRLRAERPDSTRYMTAIGSQSWTVWSPAKPLLSASERERIARKFAEHERPSFNGLVVQLSLGSGESAPTIAKPWFDRVTAELAGAFDDEAQSILAALDGRLALPTFDAEGDLEAVADAMLDFAERVEEQRRLLADVAFADADDEVTLDESEQRMPEEALEQLAGWKYELAADQRFRGRSVAYVPEYSGPVDGAGAGIEAVMEFTDAVDQPVLTADMNGAGFAQALAAEGSQRRGRVVVDRIAADAVTGLSQLLGECFLAVAEANGDVVAPPAPEDIQIRAGLRTRLSEPRSIGAHPGPLTRGQVARGFTRRNRRDEWQAMLIERDTMRRRVVGRSYYLRCRRRAELVWAQADQAKRAAIVAHMERVIARMQAVGLDPAQVRAQAAATHKALTSARGVKGAGAYVPASEPKLTPRWADGLAALRFVQDTHALTFERQRMQARIDLAARMASGEVEYDPRRLAALR